MAQYLSSSDEDFDDITEACPEVSAEFLEDEQLDGWLLRGSERIDVGGPWQGRKFDPDQELEFPRLAYGELAVPSQIPQPGVPASRSGRTSSSFGSGAIGSSAPVHPIPPEKPAPPATCAGAGSRWSSRSAADGRRRRRSAAT